MERVYVVDNRSDLVGALGAGHGDGNDFGQLYSFARSGRRYRNIAAHHSGAQAGLMRGQAMRSNSPKKLPTKQ